MMKKAIILAVSILGLNALLPTAIEVQAITTTEKAKEVRDSYSDMLKRQQLK